MSRVPFTLMCLVTLETAPLALRAQDLRLPDSLPPGVTPAMIARGKAVFDGEGLCANCHGEDAMGLLGPNLTDADWWHAQGDYLAIVERVLSGVREEESVSGITMPPRGGSTISDDDVQAVAAYVWRLSHPEHIDSLPLGVTEAMISRGGAVFHGEGRCQTCHGADATGGLGPNLTDATWLHAKGSYLSIVTQVLLGVPAELSRSGTTMLPRGGARISDADVHAVAAYVWVLSRQQR